MSAPVSYNTSLAQTLIDVAANINAHTSSPNFTAVANGLDITLSGTVADGASNNSKIIVMNVTTLVDGPSSTMNYGVTNAVTSVKVDGIEILNTPVNWGTSNSVLAANVATQIQSYGSTPEYNASVNTATVTVSGAAGSGATPNGKALTVTVAGNVTVTVNGTALMAGGINAVAGQAQVSTVTIGGTFQALDKFTVVINDYSYGYNTRPQAQGTTLLTLKKKMYSGGEGTLYFSGVNQPTKYSTGDTGAGAINMTNEARGFKTIVALGAYFNDLAVFGKKSIQIWDMRADPSENTQKQIISNVATISPKSVQGLADGDNMFLARNGFRSLKARDSSNFASVAETGTAIDEDVKALVGTLTEDQKTRIPSVIEPLDNRYWSAISTLIYVFSYFSGSKVSAWSQYEPGFSITDFAVIDDFLYSRSGDTIYLYGGDDGGEYVDAEETVVTLPFLDGKAPATKKKFSAMDVALEGAWLIQAATDPNQPDAYEDVMEVNSVTFAMQSIPYEAESTHISVRFISQDDGYGKISTLAIHYDGGDAD
jgi:hypothetical protein